MRPAIHFEFETPVLRSISGVVDGQTFLLTGQIFAQREAIYFGYLNTRFF